METKKQIDIIREKCKEKGLNIYDVFREAKVHVGTVANWKAKEPEAFTTLAKVEKAIEVLSEKQEV